MIVIISIYIVLFALAGGAYWLVRKRNPHSPGFWKWLKLGMAGMKERPEPAIPSSQAVDPSARAEDVVAVLEDLYEEFTAQLKRLEARLDQGLAQLEADFETRLRTLEQVQTTHPSNRREDPTELSQADDIGSQSELPEVACEEEQELAPEVEPEPIPTPPSLHDQARGPASVNPAQASGETVYLSILDGLYNGLNDSEIATNLGVSESEVERVRRILQSPDL